MITQSDLNQVEKFADRLFAKVGIDVESTSIDLTTLMETEDREVA